MRHSKIIALMLLCAPLAGSAQQIKSSYIDWGIRGTAFPDALKNWQKGQKWSDDDNFFISRVKPKVRFRNAATQVNPALTEENDKKLIFWVPINNETFNALPDGVFDSEVFPMWSYVTHYGNWSTQLIRIPGNFSDVAHKNGVPVSAVASVPWGTISASWKNALYSLTECGGEKVSDFLDYYGVDGIGYNSEFSVTLKDLIPRLQDLHADIIHRLKDTGRNPLAENIWYDGTNDNGTISFDNGLSTHNIENWGYGDNIRTALFFNYNWNNASLLKRSVNTAEQYGRTPLDLYCGINMQGKEPQRNTNQIWTLLKDYNLSIGLWGAHSENMFWESRAEKGPKPDDRLRSYLLRMEKWFTGGTRNPVNDLPINNSLKIAADNDSFFGMSKMMSARSALKWDLSEEPFISYFNLGNGKFFNLEGKRCHNSEWYNIGIQDYLPTWMWWFSKSFMGRRGADVPANGLNAEFTWDDAWNGGSLVRINGSTNTEYLHLFKTEFPLAAGDVVTVRYKIVDGSADAALVLSAKGAEDVESTASIMTPAEPVGYWRERKFVIGQQFASLAGKEVAMIALKFKNAANLDMRLGEISIIRPNVTSTKPATPVIEKAQVLSARHDGVDGKIIFNMPNNKGNDVCYNSDVNTSLFKLYAREEGKEPVLMGMTTSWAGLMFSIPVEYKDGKKVALGVSAMSMDMTNESDIAWSQAMELDAVYEPSDNVILSKYVINPGDAFSVRYADANHAPAKWTLTDASGKTVASAENATELVLENGLQDVGNYNVIVDGMETIDGETTKTSRQFNAMVQITGSATGNIPYITSASVNGLSDAEIALPEDTKSAVIGFSAKPGEATLARGIRVGEGGVGFRYADTKLPEDGSFTVSFWLKPDNFNDKAAHLLNIRDKGDAWSNNNWGWFWHTVDANGYTDAFTMRMATGGNVNYRFDNTRIEPGVWHHFAYVFDRNASGQVLAHFYLDGKEQTVTSWSRNDQAKSGNPTYQGTTYGWRANNVVAVGGFLHKSGSATGNLDNLMLWNSALDANGVAKSMQDINPASLPAGLVSAFDFEKDCANDYTFTGVGTTPFKAGSHDYEATEVEGQGTVKWIKPTYCAGAPTLSGSAFNLKTTVEFTNEGGSVADIAGNNTTGRAKLVFPYNGTYLAGVTLKNEYGEHTKQFKITVGDASSSIENVTTPSADVTPNPFDNYLDIVAPTDGSFHISLVGMDGRRLLANDFNADAQEAMRIYPVVPAGMYVVTVEQDGKLISSQRVLKR